MVNISFSFLSVMFSIRNFSMVNISFSFLSVMFSIRNFSMVNISFSFLSAMFSIRNFSIVFLWFSFSLQTAQNQIVTIMVQAQYRKFSIILCLNGFWENLS